ncbi:Capsular polysaccharide biosynthesis protein [Anaerorhabdus furcosa]|uniref:Capsular polysaccharide biosynthesis protein n=1 Tax=Anaerorhabdus furcosa TaxID=118967 RepID=A0A1T4NDY7_9FIRM|nr:Capsular polysaccharide biosynthesis protein [Anaerorhabdus furcosa]
MIYNKYAQIDNKIITFEILRRLIYIYHLFILFKERFINLVGGGLIVEDNYMEIDLVKIWEAFKRVWVGCVVVCIASLALSFLITNFLITPKYKATGKIIVVQRSDAQNSQLNINDVNVSQKLVTTYSEILLSERISDLVLEKLQLDFSSNEYKEMVKVGAASNTEVINISVVSPDAQEATNMVNTIIDVFQNEIYDIMNVENVSVLNEAKLPEYQDSPSLIKNMLIGLVIGIMLSGIIVFVYVFRDTTIKSEQEFKDALGYPIIGVIPDFGDEMARLEKSND